MNYIQYGENMMMRWLWKHEKNIYNRMNDWIKSKKMREILLVLYSIYNILYYNFLYNID